MFGIFMKICRENPNLVEIRREHGTLYVSRNNVLLLSAILNSHKVALFKLNDVRLLGLPRRYKYYANALNVRLDYIVYLVFFC